MANKNLWKWKIADSSRGKPFVRVRGSDGRVVCFIDEDTIGDQTLYGLTIMVALMEGTRKLALQEAKKKSPYTATLREAKLDAQEEGKRIWEALKEAEANSENHPPEGDDVGAPTERSAPDAGSDCAGDASAPNIITTRKSLVVPKLALEPRIQDLFAEELAECGLAGEERTVKTVNLVVTSRVLAHPIAAVLKGHSSAGKNYITKQVITHFPPSAYVQLTAMSPKALYHWKESLVHRILIFFEVVGFRGEDADHMVRTLISEGRLEYMVSILNDKTKKWEAEIVTREGPTGFLSTTTEHSLNPENETRILSIPVNETAEQTCLVMDSVSSTFEEFAPRSPDLELWHEFQEWIYQVSDPRVIVPFARVIASMIPPELAIRLRRDISLLHTLIQSQAILHQASREHNREGRVIASIEDYAVVRELVGDLMAEGVEVTVPKRVRETYAHVHGILAKKTEWNPHATAAELKEVMEVKHRSTVLRRVQEAIEKGFLRNDELRPNCPWKVQLADKLPDDRQILPDPEAVEEEMNRRRADLGDVAADVANEADVAAEMGAEARIEASEDGCCGVAANPEGGTPQTEKGAFNL